MMDPWAFMHRVTGGEAEEQAKKIKDLEAKIRLDQPIFLDQAWETERDAALERLVSALQQTQGSGPFSWRAVAERTAIEIANAVIAERYLCLGMGVHRKPRLGPPLAPIPWSAVCPEPPAEK